MSTTATNPDDDFRQFLDWEATTRDTIDFKKTYVDMTGDVLAGLVLSEILYWYLPSKTTNTVDKLRVIRDGHAWIACSRAEWWDRVRLSPRQMDNVFAKLQKIGLIEKKSFRFNGLRTTHIRIIKEKFNALWDETLKNPPQNPHLPNGETEARYHQTVIPKLPNGETEVTETVRPITESTTETTTHINDDALAAVIAAYEQHASGTLSPLIMDGLKELIDTYDAETIINAIQSRKKPLYGTQPIQWEINDKAKTKTPPPGSAKPPSPQHAALLQALRDGYGITDKNARGGTVGAIAAWLAGEASGDGKDDVGKLSHEAQPEHVAQFFAWWQRKYPTATAPRKFVKFTEHWRTFAGEMQRADHRDNIIQLEAQEREEQANTRMTPEEFAQVKVSREEYLRMIHEDNQQEHKKASGE